MLEGFHDVLFPIDIALGSRGGPAHRTEIVTLKSGAERRVARWSGALRRFNAGYGIKCRSEMDRVIAFFHARQGRRFAFRWRDPFDHQSSVPDTAITALDQQLGVGDGVTTEFQLVKAYESGPHSTIRDIQLPVAGSVLIAGNGQLLTEGADYTVDSQNGVVTFATPPALDVLLTAGFMFDLPARFDKDELIVSLEAGGSDIADIPIVEVRV